MEIICLNPQVFALREEILPDIRICTHKGNHIIYTIDEVKKHVIVLGILSIYQQIKSDHLEERKQSGIS